MTTTLRHDAGLTGADSERLSLRLSCRVAELPAETLLQRQNRASFGSESLSLFVSVFSTGGCRAADGGRHGCNKGSVLALGGASVRSSGGCLSCRAARSATRNSLEQSFFGNERKR
jgi:hypothetical protein